MTGSIVAGVIDQAARQGESTAIEFKGQCITYKQLIAEAQVIATLIERSPTAGPVAIYAHRDPSTIAAIIGVLMAGRPYLPVNPADPANRRRVMMDAAGAEFIIDTTGMHSSFPAPSGEIRNADSSRCAGFRDVDSDDLAYVFFTSGSTGAPKGVPLSHGNAAAFVDWARARFAVSSEDRVGVYSPLYFDLSTFDLFVGLGSGATLVLVPDDLVMFGRAVQAYLREHSITILYTVPSALSSLLAGSSPEFPDLRLLILAGEAFPSRRLDQVRSCAPSARLFNLYGPIEANVVTCFEVTSKVAAGEPIPIGEPCSGAELMVDAPDSHGVGELVVSGPSVFTGYLSRPFAPPCPFMIKDGRRWYRTGDLAQRDGSTFLLRGRIDSRIKRRGYRIELDEVEMVIGSLSPQLAAAVVYVPDSDGSGQLHAFVATPGPQQVTQADVFEQCARGLPRYMWPDRVHFLPALPTGRTGKVDRQRLRELADSTSPPS